MKRLLLYFVAAVTFCLVGCSEYDDSKLWETVNNHESRITALEELCKQINTNISSLQTIVNALEQNDYITNVSPVQKDGKLVGYTITFAKSGIITIYNGEDGKDGADGNGSYTPQIGVKKDSDNIYYWVVDGEWLLDEDGNKIKAVGKDGKDGIDGEDGTDGEDGEDGEDGKDGIDGEDGKDGTDGEDGITPRLKIENDYWYVSYDEGESWQQLGKATGADGQDGQNGQDGIDGNLFFKSIEQDEDCVIFTFADGSEISVLKSSAISNVKLSYIPRYSDGKATVIYLSIADSEVEFDFQVMPASAAEIIAKDWQTMLELKAVETLTRAVNYIAMPISKCVADTTNGTITITASGENLPGNFFYNDADVRAALFCNAAVGGTVSEYVELEAKSYTEIWDTIMTGIYDNIHNSFLGQQSHNYFGQKGFDYLTSLMGNDMVMTGRYAMSLYHHILDYWQENHGPVYYRWTENYLRIADANTILKKIISVEEADFEVLRFKALAQSVRGYAYLHLAYLFQLPYYMGAEDTAWGMNSTYSGSNADAPGVVLIDENTEGDQPRSTVGKIYELIVKDLTEAYDFFEAYGMLYTASHTDFDGLVVANYLMRTHMIMHNWAEAEKYAKVIVDSAPLGSAEDLMQGFSDINLQNVLFGYDVTADNAGIYASFFSQMDMFGQGYAAIGVARVAHNYLTAAIADNDIRLDWFFTTRNLSKLLTEFGADPANQETWPSSLAHYDQACKFIGAGRSVVYGSWHLGDEIFLRSEEAHFCLAEIYAHQKQYDNAISVLENVMKIRQADYAYAGQKNVAELVSEINLQKRIEFWGEGIEYLDNRRLNIPVDRTAEGTNHLADAQGVWTQDMPNFLYQIPSSVIENNTMIGPEDQN